MRKRGALSKQVDIVIIVVLILIGVLTFVLTQTTTGDHSQTPTTQSSGNHGIVSTSQTAVSIATSTFYEYLIASGDKVTVQPLSYWSEQFTIPNNSIGFSVMSGSQAAIVFSQNTLMDVLNSSAYSVLQQTGNWREASANGWFVENNTGTTDGIGIYLSSKATGTFYLVAVNLSNQVDSGVTINPISLEYDTPLG